MQPRFNFVPIVLAVLLVALTGCAAQRPVVYSSQPPTAAAEAAVQADIDACIALAHTAGAEDERGQRVATETATNAAIGGGTGVVVGALAGNAGRGGAIGAVGAGVATLLREAFRSSQPGEIHKRYVAECLNERGYKTLGWS